MLDDNAKREIERCQENNVNFVCEAKTRLCFAQSVRQYQRCFVSALFL